MFTGLVAQASNIKRDNDVQYSKKVNFLIIIRSFQI